MLDGDTETVTLMLDGDTLSDSNTNIRWWHCQTVTLMLDADTVRQ